MEFLRQKVINVSAISGTDLWNMTSEELTFHMAQKPFSLTQQVNISSTKPPTKRSNELFWLWTISSYLLDLHATSHDTDPPRNLGLTLSATAV